MTGKHKIALSGAQELRLIHAQQFEIFFDDMIVNYGRRARPQKGEHYTKASRASLCEFRFTARGLFSYLRSNSTTKPVIAIIFGRVTSTHKSEASENIIF